MKRIAFALVAALSAFTVSCSSSGTYKDGYLVKVGDKMPEFEVELTDSTVISSKDLDGKVVLLQFTASWCGVCRKEMPYIEKDIWQKHKDNPGFVLIGIDRDEPREKVMKFREVTGVTYPLGLDPGAEIFGKFAHKDSGITRNVLVDRDGKIVMLTRLFKTEEFNTLTAKVDSLLAE